MTQHPPAATSADHCQPGLAFVTHMRGSGLAVIDVTNERTLPVVGEGRHPHGLAVHPTGRWVSPAYASSGTVEVVDTRTLEVVDIRERDVLSTVDAPSPRSGAVSPVNDHWFVADTESDGVTVVDLGGDAPSRAGRVSLGTPTAFVDVTPYGEHAELPQHPAPSSCFPTDRAGRGSYT